MSPEHYDSGLIESAGNGTTNTGFAELSVTHPYVAAGTTNLTGSRFEQDPYPRAIIDRSIAYNADFCISCPTAGPVVTFSNVPQSEYFGSSLSINADK